MLKIFNIGERVVLKKERTKATILLNIGDKKVKIKDEDGFEYIINNSDLLPLDTNTDNTQSYGNQFDIKEDDLPKKDIKKLKLNKTDSSGRVKIDLHIEQLTNYYHHMQNSEIVKIQMEYCKKELDLAMFKAKHSLEIVHGIGEGVLKSEVHKLLKMYNLSFFESNNGGSTEVML